MFGGEKDPDNGDKVDVIVEVLTITITPSSICTVLYCTVLYCTMPGVRSQQRGQERRGQAAAGGRGSVGGLQ